MRPARAIPPGILPVSVAIVAFFFGSGIYNAFEDADGFRFARPVYALLDPGFSPPALLAGGMGALLALTALRAARVGARVWIVPVFAVGMLAFAAAVAAMDGREGFVAPIERTDIPDSYADAELVDAYGARGISQRWARALDDASSVHTLSHPPGPLVFLVAVRGLVGDSAMALAIVQATLSSLVLLAAWMLARVLAGDRTRAGERAALVAVALLAVAPSPVLHLFTSLDALYAMVLAGAMAFLVVGIARSDARWAAAGGAAVAVASYLTYAAVFVAIFGVGYGLVARGREAIRPLAVAALAGGGGLLALWTVAGYDVFAVYAASRDALEAVVNRRSYLYGVVASPVAWLAMAGLPAAGLAVRELVVRRPPFLVAMLLPLAVFYLLPSTITGIIPLETERTLQFVYPLAMAAAGAAFVRWEDARGAPAPGTLAVLVAFTAAQTIVIEVVYSLFW